MAIINGNPASLAVSLPRLDLERTAAATPTTGPAPDFGERLRELVDDVRTREAHAEEASRAYANGDRNDLHGTMIALEQADITFRFASNVRGRLIEAYREVMRMGG